MVWRFFLVNKDICLKLKFGCWKFVRYFELWISFDGLLGLNCLLLFEIKVMEVCFKYGLIFVFFFWFFWFSNDLIVNEGFWILLLGIGGDNLFWFVLWEM